jgi:transposase
LSGSEDLSDRELEKFLSENNASKWFCQFGLTDKTPDRQIKPKQRPKNLSHQAS